MEYSKKSVSKKHYGGQIYTTDMSTESKLKSMNIIDNNWILT
jgi:hypothetical protein